ncbi:MAG: OmpA family protein [Firmicutes bacterium]|nr:OmpA family protein [Bacillota bacterium]
MTTYSDMVTLLLTFFVLLFSMSNVDVQKFQAILSAFRGSLGVLDGGMSLSGDIGLQSASELAIEQLYQLEQELKEFIVEQGFEGSVQLQMEERGLIIRFADQIFFDLGKADLKPEAVNILNQLGPMLNKLPNPIRIEGHTDNLPINTIQFPSNWELSTYRATSVIRYLIEHLDLDPDKLSAAGYGEYRPVVDNTNDKNRALNRRVDIIIMRIDLWSEEPN